MVDLNKLDVKRRRPVWAALAELFLDTEVRPEVIHAAATCLSSGYSEQTLREIWRHEVSAVLASNLLNPAGEWTSFDLDWLESEILKRRAKVTDRLLERVALKSWDEVCRLRSWLSTWPLSDREQVVYAFTSLTRGAYELSYSEESTSLDPHSCKRIWEEGVAPLITALYVRGYEAPLEEFLHRGRDVLKKMISRDK